MASFLLKRSCNPSALRSVVGSLGIASSSRTSATSCAVGSDVVSAAPDVSTQKSRIWDETVSSKISTTPVNDLLKDKKVVNFGLPDKKADGPSRTNAFSHDGEIPFGAQTGVCVLQHVPSYKNNIDKFKANGINSVLSGAVNNPYVMNGRAEKLGAKDAVKFHSGTDASVPKSSDLQKDFSQPSDILRPLSPHLPVYKPQINATFSIYHRITGGLLSGVVLTFYLLFMKMGLICFTFEKFYQFFYYLYSPKLILISCEITALALAYHTFHGIRHLVTDFGGSTFLRMGRKIVK